MSLLKNNKYSKEKEKMAIPVFLPEINGRHTLKENTPTSRSLAKVESLPDIKLAKDSYSPQKQSENSKIIIMNSTRNGKDSEIVDNEYLASSLKETVRYKSEERNNNSKLNKLKIPTNSSPGLLLQLEESDSNFVHRSNDFGTSKHGTPKIKRSSDESPRIRDISNNTSGVTPSKFRVSRGSKLIQDTKKETEFGIVNGTNININSSNISTLTIMSNGITNPNINNAITGVNGIISSNINNVEHISAPQTFRHLIFSPKVSDITFSKYLAVTQKGISYSVNFLRGPSETYLKSRQISLQNFPTGTSLYITSYSLTLEMRKKSLILDLDETLIWSCSLQDGPDRVVQYESDGKVFKV